MSRTSSYDGRVTAVLIAAAALVGLGAGAFIVVRRRGAHEVDPPAGADQIENLATVLLGRPREPGDPLPGGDPTLRQAAAALAASDAHRAALQGGGAAAMAGTPAAEAVLPPGTLSPDGVAIVGSGGWLYIAHGANDFVRQYRGELPLSADGLSAWAELLDHRTRAAADLGVPLVCLAVPDKLAMYPEHYPQPLGSAERPIEQILEVVRPGSLTYPLEELHRARARADVSMRTDSHVTSTGAAVLAQTVLRELGFARRAPRERPAARPHLLCGDLGTKFDPKLQEIVRGPEGIAGLELVEDNATELLPLGAHLGVRRVTHNPAAPIDARLVIFGDSYSYIEPSAAGNLGERLASAFREVHFVWAPFCWDMAYLEKHRPDAVLLQMAERFVVTVPRRDVDVEGLAIETLRRKSGIVPEEITTPAVASAAPDPATS